MNGAKCRLMPDGHLRVASGLPTDRSMRLDLSEADRPVAFAQPLVSDELEPRCSFDPASRASIHGVLLQFDTWLRLLRAQFALGAQILQFGPALRHGVFHVSRGEHLLAVLDFRKGTAALSPRVDIADLRHADWNKRPIGAAVAPAGFLASSPAQLAWTYVCRTDRDMLPLRYREQPIHFRGTPRVPPAWLRDSQLLLLRELAAEPATLPELQQRTGFAPGRIDRELACLYYAGALTTSESKSARPRNGYAAVQPQSSGTELMSSWLLRAGGAVPIRANATLPAMLRRA